MYKDRILKIAKEENKEISFKKITETLSSGGKQKNLQIRKDIFALASSKKITIDNKNDYFILTSILKASTIYPDIRGVMLELESNNSYEKRFIDLFYLGLSSLEKKNISKLLNIIEKHKKSNLKIQVSSIT